MRIPLVSVARATVAFRQIEDLTIMLAGGGCGAATLVSQQHEDGYWCGEFEAEDPRSRLRLCTCCSHGRSGAIPKSCDGCSGIKTTTAVGDLSAGPIEYFRAVKTYFGLKLVDSMDHRAV